MTIRMSSGLQHAVITNYGIGRMMYGGHIAIYSGAQPVSADHPAPGTLLARITQNGLPPPTYAGDSGGLELESGAWGEIVGRGEWLMTCVADGTPGWWRFYEGYADAGGGSDTACRIDGVPDESIFGLPASLSAGTVTRISSFSLRFLP